MQLSTLENLSKENIIFHEPKECQLKNSNIKYKRIKIEIKCPNGKMSPLVLETPFLFSFGVNERKNQETNQNIMEIMKHQVLVKYYITNKLNTKIQKVKQKKER